MSRLTPLIVGWLRHPSLSPKLLLLPIVALLLFAGSGGRAQAQATRTWVSGVGDDANPCSRTAPCKTFAGAISKTATGGEINVLDPGGFGGVTITKSITIRSTFEAGVLVSGTNAIIISATATSRVVLDGLDIEGLGTGLNGIHVIGAVKEVAVFRTQIRAFTQSGINMASTTLGARLLVDDVEVLFNNVGITVAGSANVATIMDTEIQSNTTTAVAGNGAGVIFSLTRTLLNGSPNAVTEAAGAQGFSFGPSNVISGAGVGLLTVLPFN